MKRKNRNGPFSPESARSVLGPPARHDLLGMEVVSRCRQEPLGSFRESSWEQTLASFRKAFEIAIGFVLQNHSASGRGQTRIGFVLQNHSAGGRGQTRIGFVLQNHRMRSCCLARLASFCKTRCRVGSATPSRSHGGASPGFTGLRHHPENLAQFSRLPATLWPGPGQGDPSWDVQVRCRREVRGP